ncbi:MAG: LamG-like jellyroll fold domain-containing protein [Prolixibacteraceae bacterium]
MKRKLLLISFLSLLMSYTFAESNALTLKHSYSFTDGTAADEVGTAHGTLVGGNIINGAYVTSANNQYVELPAANIAINTYESVTFEAYTIASSAAPTNAMLWYFGGSVGGLGANGTFLAAQHWSGGVRAAISCGSDTEPWNFETPVDGEAVNTLDEIYHLLVILSKTNISLYVNGALVGTTEYTGTNSVSALSNDFAWIGRGGYSGDPTWLGTVLEFNIYSGVMDETTIAAHALDIPIETSIPTLASLTSSVGTLDPSFDSELSDYEITVPYGVTSLKLTGVATETGSTIKMFDGFGNEIIGGMVKFDDKGIDVEIIVTGLDGSQYTYYVAIFVEKGDAVALMGNFELSAGALDPILSDAVTEYTVVVPKGTTSLTIGAKPKFPNATVKGDGKITLTNGKGSATITVTSFDKSTTLIYKVNIVEADGKNHAIRLSGVNGDNSNINISGLPINKIPYTMELWFKPEGSQLSRTGLIFGRNAANNDNGGIQYLDNDNIIGMSNSDTDYDGINAGQAISDAWHHVAFVVTDNMRTIYLDGVETTQEDINVAVDYSASNVYIGYDKSATNRAFKGAIDEVRIWNTNLSKETIDKNKFAVLKGNEANLVGYWNFDLPNTAQAVELTSNKLHGKITGGTYVESFPRTNLDMDTLYIEGFDFVNDFSPKRVNYTMIFPVGTTTAKVVAKPEVSGVTVSGAGNVTINPEGGQIVITVKTADGASSYDYIISYLVDTELTLKHSYTFADGTAQDVVGAADGVINSGEIVDGTFISTETGNFITLPAEEIAINSYPSITLEAYVLSGNNTTFTMLIYFGGLTGSNSFWIQPTRGDNASRADVITGTEATASGPQAQNGVAYHYVAVLTYDVIQWYINGELISEVPLPANVNINKLSLENAWIGKSGWSDPTWLGSIYEMNIYSGAMNAETVALRSLTFPTDNITSLATLSALSIDGVTPENFKPYVLNYEVNLPKGTTTIPTVAGTVSNANASMVITPADKLPGTTTIVVTAEDGVTKITYNIVYKVAVSDDASLSSLTVDGVAINGFNTAILSYDVKLPSGTTQVPTVVGIATETNASVVVNKAAGLPGTTTVVVTAEDGVSKRTYSINFSVKTGVNDLSSSSVKVFPTISNTYFTVKTDGSMSTISVYDLTGSKIETRKSNMIETKINTEKPGIYLIRVENNSTVQTFKVIRK